MIIETMDAGYRRMLDYLMRKGFMVIHVYPINKKRYMIVKGLKRTVFIMFKREPFYNFGSQFQEQGCKGSGDSINVEDLKTAIQKGATDIYTVFSSGRAYTISIQEFLEKSIEWRNEEGKKVRSISIHEYKMEAEI